MREKTILLVGGDQRQKELYEIIKKDNFNVFSYGLFENEAVSDKCDILILPFPTIKENKINAPFSKQSIFPKELNKFIGENTKIFGGNLPEELFKNNFVYDYGKNENLIYYNAFLTAEAAISIAISNSKKSLRESKILITGMGRISKHLALMLKAFNSEITICARKESDRAFANSLGFVASDFSELKNLINKHDFVFNTVPQIVFDNKVLSNKSEETLFIDLASSPGGFEDINNLNFIKALALPGKYSPESAALIIYKTIRPYLN